jgi:ElaB/YqjD/DUF883 family membrane-anchored ribosome-binding protein
MTARHESTSREYAREAEVTRHRLAGDLDELSDRLTPGQIFDEMLTYAKGGGGTFLRALSNASRENPIPSLLIGAGCMMFLSEKMGLNRYLARHDHTNGQSSYSNGNSLASEAASRVSGAARQATDATASTARSVTDSVRSGVRRTTDFASEQASEIADSIKEGAESVAGTVSSAGRQVSSRARDMANQASDAASKVKQGAQDLAGTAQEYSGAIRQQVADTAGQTKEQAVRAARQAKDSAKSFVNEQPLVAAAIGLAIGAAIAALLPKTETEDELMGEASDAIKGAVGEAASEQLKTAKQAATSVMQEAKGVAEREGLTPAGAADIARNVGEKVKRVVGEMGSAAESQVREMAGTQNKG